MLNVNVTCIDVVLYYARIYLIDTYHHQLYISLIILLYTVLIVEKESRWIENNKPDVRAINMPATISN